MILLHTFGLPTSKLVFLKMKIEIGCRNSANLRVLSAGTTVFSFSKNLLPCQRFKLGVGELVLVMSVSACKGVDALDEADVGLPTDGGLLWLLIVDAAIHWCEEHSHC